MFKKLRVRLKNQKGFTLVELLAVIVILAVIAAIAIPSITGIVANQKQKANVQDALNIIHAAKLYNSENGDQTNRTITYDDLKNSLDHVSDTSFTVTVTNGVYSISGHDGIADSTTEQKLVDDSK
ncbi:prepilin-type N-terminal cleavage/methylation domain-containing protein [Sporolactobacillus sp. THM7-4]|nr:prepilin-type N-terminal cleavage/methylation domain-containing protein [Sporolactobacillus sp. THM7-4]